MDGDQDMHGKDVMYMTDDNYRYDFKEVDNAIETESEGEDESSHIVGTKSKTYGEDEAENI